MTTTPGGVTAEALLSKAEAVDTFLRWLREEAEAGSIPKDGVAFQRSLIQRLFAESQKVRQTAIPTRQAAGRKANGYYELAMRLRRDLLTLGLFEPMPVDSAEPKEVPSVEEISNRPTLTEPVVAVPAPVVKAVQDDIDFDNLLPSVAELGETRGVSIDRRLSSEIPDLDDVPDYNAVDAGVNREQQAQAQACLQAFLKEKDDFFALPVDRAIRPPAALNLPDGPRVLIIRTVRFTKKTLQYNWNCVVNGKVAGSNHPLMIDGPDGTSLVERQYHDGDERFIRALRAEEGALLRYFLHEGPIEGEGKGRNLDQHARYFQVRNGVPVKLTPKEFWTMETAAKSQRSASMN